MRPNRQLPAYLESISLAPTSRTINTLQFTMHLQMGLMVPTHLMEIQMVLKQKGTQMVNILMRQNTRTYMNMLLYHINMLPRASDTVQERWCGEWDWDGRGKTQVKNAKRNKIEREQDARDLEYEANKERQGAGATKSQLTAQWAHVQTKQGHGVSWGRVPTTSNRL